jgi:transposase
MPSLQRYPVEFRRGAVELAKQSGKSIRELAKELNVSETTLGRWVVHEFTRGEPGETANEEVAQLRRECARLMQEREILKKALALYARETFVR